jgi:aryl-alcohol dehydrogenase-like predicted oxidoreductase
MTVPDESSKWTRDGEEPTRRQVLTRMGLGLTVFGALARHSWSLAAGEPAQTPQATQTPQAPEAKNAAAAGSIRIGDLTVHRLGFGAMRITGEGVWGPPRDPAEARAVLRRAVELGVDFIDTADAYGPEVSEQLIFEALHPYSPGLVIATKGGYVRPGPDKWEPAGSAAHLRAACEGSLRRLHLERIELYQLHTPDPKVPIEESIGELVRLRQQGKIRHIGVSNVTLAQLEQARALAPVVSVQNRYNLADRSSEDVLRYCASERLAFLPWAPLSGRDSPRLLPWASAAEHIAKTHSVSTAQIALAWLLARSPAMLPIPGTSSRVHLEDNVAAAALRLTPGELEQLS